MFLDVDPHFGGHSSLVKLISVYETLYQLLENHRDEKRYTIVLKEIAAAAMDKIETGTEATYRLHTSDCDKDVNECRVKQTILCIILRHATFTLRYFEYVY